MATDAEIRAAGLYAVPRNKYLQNEFQLPTNTPTETEEITESFGIPYTNAFTETGGGGGQGGGKFGNQDMSDYKDFNMPGFDKPVRGFKNVNTGMYQDIDGLNIQNLGINSFGMAGILEKAFGLKNEDDDPKYPGYFTKNKFGALLKNPGSFKHYYDRQDKKKQDALQKEIEEANIAAAQTAQLSREGREKYTGEGQAFAPRTDTFTKGEVVDSPSTPGGKYGSPKKDGGRIGYFFGGRARLQGGGMSQGNEANISQSTNMGGGATGDFSTAEQTMNHNKAIRNAAKKTTPVKNIIDTGSELNYLNNLKNLNLPGIVLGFGVNKFRDFISNKKTKEEEDKLSYNTNNLPTNNYFTDLNAAQIKQLEGPQKMGKEYGNFSDQEILDNITPFGDEETAPATLKDVQTFYGSNGGRAMFKNGGLAGLL